MPIAIVTDSTCDLSAQELADLDVQRVPLYVHFRGETFKDWIEITPGELIRGMQEGAESPTTSQPTPEDFSEAYRNAVANGADEVLVLTISSGLSGTYQSAELAAKDAPVPVTVFDSRHASIGVAYMIRRAAAMRDAGAPMSEVMAAMETIRDKNLLLFTVGTLEFLQRGGRIGRASALLGSILNIKPILSLDAGTVEPAGRARGAKKALKEMVSRLETYRSEHPEGELVLSFIHIQDPDAADRLRTAIRDAGIEFRDAGLYEMGAVIGVHVGPGTYGYYALADATPELGM
ncbi:MAG: DegV family protein [Trueperaceae bacterium]|nr:DegV family protein [Trueperaceae bacterium]